MKTDTCLLLPALLLTFNQGACSSPQPAPLLVEVSSLFSSGTETDVTYGLNNDQDSYFELLYNLNLLPERITVPGDADLETNNVDIACITLPEAGSAEKNAADKESEPVSDALALTVVCLGQNSNHRKDPPDTANNYELTSVVNPDCSPTSHSAASPDWITFKSCLYTAQPSSATEANSPAKTGVELQQPYKEQQAAFDALMTLGAREYPAKQPFGLPKAFFWEDIDIAKPVMTVYMLRSHSGTSSTSQTQLVSGETPGNLRNQLE